MAPVRAVRLRGRVLLLVSVVASGIGGCGGSNRKGDLRGPPAKPECECASQMEEDCSCVHCGMRDGGMERVECPCAGRGFK